MLNPLCELVQTRRISHDASRHAISGLMAAQRLACNECAASFQQVIFRAS
jgi:hypothetical protein